MALDGLNFAIVGYHQKLFIEGDVSAGLIVDERASKEQQDGIVAIGSGQAGGPMAAIAPLIGTFLGVESKPIRFQGQGMSWSVSVPGVLDLGVEGVASPVKEGEPLYLDNTMHPVNARLALAKATRGHLHAFGLNWDDDSGRKNGHFAPFNWSG